MNNHDNKEIRTSLSGHINTLEDIAEYKARVKEEIKADERRIGEQWQTLFKADEYKGNNRWMGILNTSMGMLDGAILGWKLYRQFKKNPIFKKFR